MRYLISYDLDKPGQNYPKIITELESMGAQRVLYSQWVANRTGTTSEGLRNYLKQFIDTNDRLLVVALSDDWASYRAMVDINTV